MLLFEPEKAHEIYYTLDDADIIKEIGGKSPRNTKKYREWKAETLDSMDTTDKMLVSNEEWRRANDMIKRLKDCGLYDKRFAGASIRSSSMWTSTESFERISSTACKTTASLTRSHRGPSTSSGTTSTASAMTSKHTSTPRCLTSRISIGCVQEKAYPLPCRR